MPKFVSKPSTVEAFQWFLGHGCTNPAVSRDTKGHYVVTIHGQAAYLSDGDWVITEPNGTSHYPCKPDIFAAKYTPVAEPQVANRDRIMQFFEYAHLPEHLKAVSQPFCELAGWIESNLPLNPERTVALRKLLEAKDAAVRSKISK